MMVYYGGCRRSIEDTSVQGFARMISEFALEYRTARGRLLQKKQKKQDKGERSRTRGKTIIEVYWLLIVLMTSLTSRFRRETL